MDVSAKRRRTQAERSADTRERVLDAAVRCLHKNGYTATTALLVAEEAGISRGAMLHQFPTKTDLMLFVVRQVFDQDVARFNARLKKGKPSEEDLIEMVWESTLSPGGVATLEIMLGARSDRALARSLIPLQAEIERDALRAAEILLPEGKGIASLVGMRLITWAMRGFAISDLVSNRFGESREMAMLFQKTILKFVRSKHDKANFCCEDRTAPSPRLDEA